MGSHLSSGTWIIIGLIAFFFLALNLSLVIAWLKKDKAGNGGSILPGLLQSLGGSGNRDNDQMRELSSRVKKFRQMTSSREDDPDEE